ncbi:MAG: helix-turn-helix transcriptional regulator [Chitinophagales bacterium]|nr:helix-turn-helix transcriptional regulator [Chitinophagales bacterium]
MEHMANQLNISRTQYSNIENGHTSSIKEEQKQKISELLDIDAELIEVRENGIVINNPQVGIVNGENTINNNVLDEKLVEKIEQILSINEKLQQQINELNKLLKE